MQYQTPGLGRLSCAAGVTAQSNYKKNCFCQIGVVGFVSIHRRISSSEHGKKVEIAENRIEEDKFAYSHNVAYQY
jgi:hypothetical protein